MPAIVAGNARIDEAKITGITPPVFTLSGMCVLDPAVHPSSKRRVWHIAP